MTERNRAVAGWAAALALVFGAPRAGAAEGKPEPFKVTVSYRAPPSCPSMSFLMTRLASYLEGGPGAPLYGTIDITESDAQYHLNLTSFVAVRHRRRKESSASCEELVSLAALMLAVARAEPLPASDTEPPEPPPPPGPPGTDPRMVETPPRKPVPVAASRGARLLIGAEVQSGVGVLPGVAWGTGALLELAWRSFGLRVLGTFWLPREVASPGGFDSLPALTLGLQSLDLGACLRHSLYDGAAYELGLSGCAILSGYRLTTETRQLGQASDVTYRGAAGFSAGLNLGLPGALELGLQFSLADLVQPFEVYTPPFQGPLYESKSNHLRLGLTLGYRFETSGGG